jgi:hypothetical protein
LQQHDPPTFAPTPADVQHPALIVTMLQLK